MTIYPIPYTPYIPHTHTHIHIAHTMPMTTTLPIEDNTGFTLVQRKSSRSRSTTNTNTNTTNTHTQRAAHPFTADHIGYHYPNPNSDTLVYIISYKTEQCPRNTSRPCSRLCEQYHSPKERRRSPLLYTYSEQPCQAVKRGKSWNEPSKCDQGDHCLYSHSLLEQMYHPNIYKSGLCNKYKGGGREGMGSSCTWGPLCTHAHGKEEVSMQEGAKHRFESIASLTNTTSNSTKNKTSTMKEIVQCIVMGGDMSSLSITSTSTSTSTSMVTDRTESMTTPYQSSSERESSKSPDSFSQNYTYSYSYRERGDSLHNTSRSRSRSSETHSLGKGRAIPRPRSRTSSPFSAIARPASSDSINSLDRETSTQNQKKITRSLSSSASSTSTCTTIPIPITIPTPLSLSSFTSLPNTNPSISPYPSQYSPVTPANSTFSVSPFTAPFTHRDSVTSTTSNTSTTTSNSSNSSNSNTNSRSTWTPIGRTNISYWRKPQWATTTPLPLPTPTPTISAVHTHTPNTTSSAAETHWWKERAHHLAMRIQCKGCMQQERSAVCVPCGHQMCMSCARRCDSFRSCVVCCNENYCLVLVKDK